MNDIQFSEPVVLMFGATGKRSVASIYEAIECMGQQWPEWARGRSWRAAVRVCRDALDGWRSEPEARKSFLKAASRAGLLSRDGKLA
jgi:hypothetical protein